MNILEVRNSLLKISYEEDLKLGSLLIIKDSPKSYISQVLHVEAGRIGKVALAKLLFIFDGEIREYDGSIPSVRSFVEIVSPDLLMKNFEITQPLLLGKIAQRDEKFIIDKSLIEDKLLVCVDSNENAETLIKNLVRQTNNLNKKVVVIDTISDESKLSKLVATKDFKLPLNADTLDYICEYGLSDANAEGKAVIEEVFSDIREYSKTVPFIPFDVFRQVVDNQYQQTKMLQLVLLNSKLRRYDEKGIFAVKQSEIECLDNKLRTETAFRIDLSHVDDLTQKEFIAYILNRIALSNDEYCVLLRMTNGNSDKKLLKQFLFSDNIHPTVICSYTYKYLTELKQLVSNIMLFLPQQQQSDFTGYNVFINKLLNDEYIVFGKSTKHVPFIIKLEEITEVLPVQYRPNYTEIAIELPVQADNRQENFDFQPEISKETETVELNNVELPTNEVESSVNDETADIEQEIEIQEPTQYEHIERLTLTDEEIAEEADKMFTGTIPDYVEDEELSDEDLDLVDELEDDFDIVEDEDTDKDADIEISEDKDEIENEVIEIVESDFPPQSDDALNITESTENSNPSEEFDFDVSDDFENIDNEETNNLSEEMSDNKINQEYEIDETDEPLPTKTAVSQAVPIYSADIPKEDTVLSDEVVQGDMVIHAKHGRGLVEKIINYGNKSLCFISFETQGIGKRLIDPTLELLKKI